MLILQHKEAQTASGHNLGLQRSSFLKSSLESWREHAAMLWKAAQPGESVSKKKKKKKDEDSETSLDENRHTEVENKVNNFVGV